jgi:hypothetical protein
MKINLLAVSLSLATPELQVAEKENLKTRKTGELLFQYDMASAFASDYMIENWKNYGKHALNGYLTIKEGRTWRVVYTGANAGVPSSYYEVILRKEIGKPDTAIENDPPRHLNNDELPMYYAERTANEADRKSDCSESPNKILVPRDGGWSVYFIATTTQPGKVVVGGHYRVDIDIYGKKILNTEQFTNSCLEIPFTEEDEGKSSIYLTHIRSKLPNEMHYYLTLLHNLKLYVSIDKDVWFLTKDVIVYIGDREKMKAWKQ